MDLTSKSRLPVFCGNGDSVDTFIMQLEMAFALRPNLDDDKKRIAFVCSCLSEAALLWFEDAMQKHSLKDLTDSSKTIIENLKQTFTDPSASTTARLELADLAYSPPVSVFTAKFNAIQLKIKNSNMADRVFAFLQKLPPAML